MRLTSSAVMSIIQGLGIGVEELFVFVMAAA